MHDEINKRIAEALTPEHLEIQIDGNRAALLIVSDQFESLNRVKRQQKVYALIDDFLKSGELHAVNIQAKTPSEWHG